jgi:tyrosyl-tRNA synthetase
MGKTSGGDRVWLDRTQTSPYAYYQFWVNCDDADVERLLRFFTYLPLAEIRDLLATTGEGLREAKRRLAFEATVLLHGQADAEAASNAARALFGGADGGRSDLEVLAHTESIPTVTVDASRLGAGIGILDALVLAGLAESKGAARRLVEGGGATVNEARADLATVVGAHDLHAGVIIIRAGKKRYVRLAVSE